MSEFSPSGVAERPCAGSIVIPWYARSIIAAHLAYRRSEGAEDADPYFVHRHDPRRQPTAALREAAIRACRRLHLNPPWLHRDPCRYGADIAVTERTQGWMVERGLALAQCHLAYFDLDGVSTSPSGVDQGIPVKGCLGAAPGDYECRS